MLLFVVEADRNFVEVCAVVSTSVMHSVAVRAQVSVGVSSITTVRQVRTCAASTFWFAFAVFDRVTKRLAGFAEHRLLVEWPDEDEQTLVNDMRW